MVLCFYLNASIKAITVCNGTLFLFKCRNANPGIKQLAEIKVFAQLVISKEKGRPVNLLIKYPHKAEPQV